MINLNTMVISIFRENLTKKSSLREMKEQRKTIRDQKKEKRGKRRRKEEEEAERADMKWVVQIPWRWHSF